MNLILLDDHKLFAESMKVLLDSQKEITFCDICLNVDEFFEKLNKSVYDIILLDINLKYELTGLDLIKQLLENNFSYKIVILTSYDLENYKKIALDLGAKDFINKSTGIDELMKRLRKVYEGETINYNSKLEKLTSREQEILNELIKGFSKKDIAKKLYISERTLYNHLSNIYEKLGVTNAIEAYNRAIELGYIKPVM